MTKKTWIDSAILRTEVAIAKTERKEQDGTNRLCFVCSFVKWRHRIVPDIPFYGDGCKSVAGTVTCPAVKMCREFVYISDGKKRGKPPVYFGPKLRKLRKHLAQLKELKKSD